jgi:hypothetical protein
MSVGFLFLEGEGRLMWCFDPRKNEYGGWLIHSQYDNDVADGRPARTGMGCLCR